MCGLQVNGVPVVHGSAMFQMGETQVLSTVTVGSPEDEQRVGGLLDSGNRRLIVHYASPPFATNEVCPPSARRHHPWPHLLLSHRAT